MSAARALLTVLDMTTTELAGLAELKQFTRATWAAGNFPEIARRGLWEVGERIVQRVGIGKHERVLDVACGTGNAAIHAAQAGGDVVGLDLTPELLEAGRRLAAQADVSIEWTEGDAEAIPFEDAHFDVVLSTFGCMFAPRHRVTAREMARALQPGGRLGVCNWTPDGSQGEFFRALAASVLPMPTFAQPPLLWGTEDHVREVFAGTGMQLEFERETAVESEAFENGHQAVEFLAASFGPLIMLRARLEAQGAWADVRQTLENLYDRRAPGEYLIVLGRKA
jgi:SAM-dependent methyltransferase